MAVRIDPLDLDVLAQAVAEARPIDRIEAEYMTGRDLSDGLYKTYMMSSSAYSGWLDDELVCVWGVCALAPMEGIGVPWLLVLSQQDEGRIRIAIQHGLFGKRNGNPMANVDGF